jgi:hypothetical protein
VRIETSDYYANFSVFCCEVKRICVISRLLLFTARRSIKDSVIVFIGFLLRRLEGRTQIYECKGTLTGEQKTVGTYDPIISTNHVMHLK